jgi:sugar lactone lactonase YvrE
VNPLLVIGQPDGVAVDGSGEVYFSTSTTCLVRLVSGGIVTKVAGLPSGRGCGTSNDGPADAVQLDHPLGVAVDGTGDVYIADYGNCVVRKLSGGAITTVAGRGTHVCVYDAASGPATSVSVYPSAVAVAGDGSVYIADWANCRVRQLRNGAITTVAGVGTGLLAGCGSSGDGGSAIAAQLNKPFGVAVDGQGDVYIADTSNCRVRVVRAGTISAFAGTGAGALGTCNAGGDGGPASAATMGAPFGIAVDGAGDVFVVDSTNCNVRRVTPDGTITTVVGTIGPPAERCGFGGDGGPATTAKLNHPEGIAVDAQNNLYIADTQNCRVREVTGGVIQTIAGGDACDIPKGP